MCDDHSLQYTTEFKMPHEPSTALNHWNQWTVTRMALTVLKGHLLHNPYFLLYPNVFIHDFILASIK